MEVWHIPNQVFFGAGALGSLGDVLSTNATERVVLASDPLAAQTGARQRVQTLLEQAKIEVVTHAINATAVERGEVAALEEMLGTHHTETLVVVGSSHAIDTAKLVRPLPTANPRRLYAIPLTVADGNECSRSVTVNVEGESILTTLQDDTFLPDAAFVDIELLEARQSEDLAADAFGALARNIEAYCANGDHPIADAVALSGIRYVAQSLPSAVSDEEQPDADPTTAKQGLQKAALMSAIAVQKGQGASAALARAVALKAEISMGLAQALCLPAVLDFNRKVQGERIAQIGRLFDAKGSDQETLAFECSGAIRVLRRSAGLANSLSDVGIVEDQFEAIAAAAFADLTHEHNPRPCTQDDMLALLRASA